MLIIQNKTPHIFSNKFARVMRSKQLVRNLNNSPKGIPKDAENTVEI